MRESVAMATVPLVHYEDAPAEVKNGLRERLACCAVTGQGTFAIGGISGMLSAVIVRHVAAPFGAPTPRLPVAHAKTDSSRAGCGSVMSDPGRRRGAVRPDTAQTAHPSTRTSATTVNAQCRRERRSGMKVMAIISGLPGLRH